MRIFDIRWFRRFILTSIFTMGIVGILASGGGSGDGDNVTLNFPTPTLPAGARALDTMNANDTALEATSYIAILNLFGDIYDFKTAALPPIEAPPGIEDVIRQTIDQFYKRDPNSRSVATGVEENVSAAFCPNGGTAIANSTDTDTSAQARIDFTACDIGLDVINGDISLDISFDDATQDYSLRLGGTLIFNGVSTFVFDNFNSGNDGTGDFTTAVSYSVEGIPGGGFLVKTETAIVGNFFSGDYFSGQLFVDGNNSRVRITVVPTTTANVDVEEDSAGSPNVWVAAVPPTITLPPL